MANLSRNPLINDLIMNPSETGVLHDSSHYAQPVKGSKLGIPFSFEWMLSFPYSFTSYSTADGTKIVSIGNSPLPRLPYSSVSVDVVRPSWNCIPFCWAAYTRRKVQLTLIAVKCPVPAKFQMEYAPTKLIGSDLDPNSKRNCMKEMDMTLDRRHVIELHGLYDRAYKISSMFVSPRYVTYPVGDVLSLVVDDFDDMFIDGHYAISQLLPIQRGSLYPEKFNIFMFVSYAGTTLSTIISPSAAGQVPDGPRVISRFVSGGTVDPTVARMLTKTKI